jgi:5-methylcytosine-specific restriction endonuclease McrA
VSRNKRLSGRGLQTLRKRVFATYGDECWLCGQEGADTIDHLVMISQGGSDTIENLRPAHGRKTSYCVGNFSRRRGRFGSNQKKKSNKQNQSRPRVISENVSISYE